jgi:ABC-type nitrate/sulfonate/bicarbonate transport system permease component
MAPLVRTLLQAVIGIVVILVLWAIAAPVAISRGVAAFMAPTPGQVIGKAAELFANDGFREHFHSSLVALAKGGLPALMAGIVIGLLMRRSNAARWVFGPLVVIVAAAPVVALIPLLVLWFGLQPDAKIVLIALMTGFPVASIVMVAPLRVYDQTATRTARSALLLVTLGLRIGILFGTTALIASELIGSKSGVGFFISNAAAQLDPTSILAAFLLTAAPAILVLVILQAIEAQLAG